MKNFLLLISILYLAQSSTKTNKMCEGNFSSYPGQQGVWGQALPTQFWAFVPNTQCWYSKYTDFFEVKKMDELLGVWADLSTDQPISLCQKLSLQVNKKYKLNYILYTHATIQEFTIKIQLNNQQLISKLYQGSQTIFSDFVYLHASQQENQICFSGTPASTNINLGVMLSNVSLIVADYRQLSFNASLKESQASIVLISNRAYNYNLAQEINKRYQVMAKGQQILYKIGKQQQTSQLIIRLFPQESFWIKDLIFKPIQNSEKDEMMEITLQMICPNKHFKYLSQDQRKNLQNLQQLSDWLKILMIQIITIIKGTICSYFLFGILRFWNIGLLYIFLLIGVVPQYTKQVYYQFLTSLFELGNIFAWAKIYFTESEHFYAFSEKLGIGKTIQSQIGVYKWFGAFGFTTDILDNNYLNLCLLGALVLKIFIVKLIHKYIVRKFLRIDVGKTFTGVHIFVAEVTSLSPQFFISALCCILGPSTVFVEQLHKVSQIMIFMICISSMAIYTVFQYQKNQKQQRKTEIQQKNSIKIQKPIEINAQIISKEVVNEFERVKFKYEDHFIQSSHTFLLLTIPLLLILKNVPGFFVINSILIGIKTYSFTIKFKSLSRTDKIFETINTFVLLSHHVIFLMFYIISIMNYVQGDAISNNLNILNLLGMSAIITILFGGLIQILYTAIKGIFFLKYFIDNMHKFWKVLKTCKKRQKTQQKTQKKESKKRCVKKGEQNCIQQNQMKQQQIYIPADKNKSKKRCVKKGKKQKNDGENKLNIVYKNPIKQEQIYIPAHKNDASNSANQQNISDQQSLREFFKHKGQYLAKVIGETQNGRLQIRIVRKQQFIKQQKLKPSKRKKIIKS